MARGEQSQEAILQTFTRRERHPQATQILWLALFSVWIGMIIVGAIYAWRLVWIAWQAMPKSGASRANGIAHI